MTALHRAGMFFGLLDELASDDRVTDIAVTCEGRVWADRGSGMREHILQVPFRSPQVVRDYAVQLCAQLGRRLDDACPIADASNMHGVRVHAVIAPLVPQGASISIRFPGSEVTSLQRLAQLGMFPAGWISVLSGLVSKRAAVLITGGTGVGKTTLAKALLAQCDANDRIVTVEEVRELGDFGHGNHVSMAVRWTAVGILHKSALCTPRMVNCKAFHWWLGTVRPSLDIHLSGVISRHCGAVARGWDIALVCDADDGRCADMA